MAAHPRSRGENWQWIAGIATEVGSSPLTRGKPGRQLAGLTRQRLIPAHAGKTFGSDLRSSVAGAHPRSRGENRAASSRASPASGSSPLTRGKPSAPTCAAAWPGLIPAHAGKTSRRAFRSRQTWAHPRSRGENARSLVELLSVMGSSPLTRGKQAGLEIAAVVKRLIPAHAGKTFSGTLKLHCDRAHPRSRGENLPTEGSNDEAAGSSPLTRGKRSPLIRALQAHRLIPAHAGKTRGPPRAPDTASAHPRSRGENHGVQSRITNQTGSSPLTRGKRRYPKVRGHLEGLIPAHAGKTPGRRRSRP